MIGRSSNSENTALIICAGAGISATSLLVGNVFGQTYGIVVALLLVAIGAAMLRALKDGFWWVASVSTIVAGVFEGAWSLLGLSFAWGYNMRNFPYVQTFVVPLCFITAILLLLLLRRSNKRTILLTLATFVCALGAIAEVVHWASGGML